MTAQASGSHLVVVRVRAGGPVRRPVVRRVRLYLVLRVGRYGRYRRRGVRPAEGLASLLAALVDVLRRPD